MPTLRRALGLAALSLGAAALLSACGGAGTGAADAPASPRAELSSPEGADAELDRAEAVIQRTIGLPNAGQQAPLSNVQGQQQAAPPPPPPSHYSQGLPPQQAPVQQPGYGGQPNQAVNQAPKKGNADVIAAEDRDREHHNPCASACTALASMRRAAEHLCSLAGPSDVRCENAKGRVQRATERVKAACPSCAG